MAYYRATRRLRDAVKRSDTTQTELATSVNIQPSHLSAHLSGVPCGASIRDRLLRLAEMVDVPQCAAVVPVAVAVEDEDAFIECDPRFVQIFLRDQGVAMVLDEQTGELLSYADFAQTHGERGQQWLACEAKRGFPSLGHYQAARSAGGGR